MELTIMSARGQTPGPPDKCATEGHAPRTVGANGANSGTKICGRCGQRL